MLQSAMSSSLSCTQRLRSTNSTMPSHCTGHVPFLMPWKLRFCWTIQPVIPKYVAKLNSDCSGIVQYSVLPYSIVCYLSNVTGVGVGLLADISTAVVQPQAQSWRKPRLLYCTINNSILLASITDRMHMDTTQEKSEIMLWIVLWKQLWSLVQKK